MAKTVLLVTLVLTVQMELMALTEPIGADGNDWC